MIVWNHKIISNGLALTEAQRLMFALRSHSHLFTTQQSQSSVTFLHVYLLFLVFCSFTFMVFMMDPLSLTVLEGYHIGALNSELQKISFWTKHP